MKNQMKLTSAIAGVGLTTMLFAFKGENEEDQTEGNERRIEVIRTSNGETTIYDTTVSSTSSLTPIQYLEILGFDDDPMIEIIDLTKDHQENVFHVEKEETFIVDDEGNASKNVKMVNEINLEFISNDLEGVNLDSLISSIVVNDLEGESPKFETQVMFIEINDDEGDAPADVKWISSEDPIYHFVEEDTNRVAEVKVYGDKEDVTLVIVSGDSRKISVDEKLDEADKGLVKVFPNPSHDQINLEYEFMDEAATTITVNDINGKEMIKIERDKEQGSQKVAIEVNNWAAGTYIVNLLHGETKMVRKVVIE
ncbi:MAG: T9SS type A sorting domain-containing protein [Crocinitomicaceae bacterium]|nr:T9SS type A sorting domain-containing protein [Crocinitomicaceae bacterium]